MCGREPGGTNAPAVGVCPAAAAVVLDGVHGGTNAGRACWVVAGTFCKGRAAQGTFANKYADCGKCRFFREIRREELALVPTYILIAIAEGEKVLEPG